MSMRVSDFEVVASGLEYPEGPVCLSDGGFILVDIKAGNLNRYRPDSTASSGYRADAPICLRDPQGTLGNGPNGAAIGPDGKVYVCNNGGMEYLSLPLKQGDTQWTLNVSGDLSKDYQGGYIQRVSLDTGLFETWCGPDSVGEPVPNCAQATYPKQGLRGPDDLVFDAAGGFWFTDWGKTQGRSRDVTGVYYVPPGSQTPIEKIPLRTAANGIALSPKGDRLYVAETYARWVVYWELSGPGEIRCNPSTFDGGFMLSAAIPGSGILDSMSVDEEGNIYVATMLVDGLNPMRSGGITVISREGAVREFIAIDAGVPEPLPSNICFGGPDRRTAFITCGGTGRVVTCRMKVPGLKPAFGI